MQNNVNQPPQVICFSRGQKVPNDYKVINVTSHSKEVWSRKFSPFFLGPITVDPAGGAPIQSKNMENAWQYLKVYADQVDPNTNEINDNWYEWAQKGFSNPSAVRFPKGKGARPLFSLWKGEKLSYVEARKKVYAPLYAECVENYAANELAILRRMYEAGEKLALFDFDGYAHYKHNLSLKDVLHNEKKKMGHSFVIMGLIIGDRFWE